VEANINADRMLNMKAFRVLSLLQMGNLPYGDFAGSMLLVGASGFPNFLGFLRIEDCPFCVRGTFEPLVGAQFRILKPNSFHEGQEILSRYGSPDSLVPVLNLPRPLWRQGRHQDHVRYHQATFGLDYPECLLERFLLIEG
jgi:hypothetical protein